MSDVTARGAPRLVSVLIPVRNAERTLGEQLRALEAQTYAGPWELLVADNGSTDDSRAVAGSWCRADVPLRVIDASEARGVSHARNRGVEESRGDLIAICDGDDIVGDGWLAGLVEVAERFDVIGGRVVTFRDGTRPRTGEAHPIDTGARPYFGYLAFAPGGNMATWRSVIDEIGGWDPGFMGGDDDVDFSWRAQRAGYRLGWAYDAVLYLRERPGRRGVYQQYARYGFMDARLLKRHHQYGASALSPLVTAKVWVDLVRKGMHYRSMDADDRWQWWRQLGRRSGRLVGSVRFRTWCA